jgi:hypothetical protein
MEPDVLEALSEVTEHSQFARRMFESSLGKAKLVAVGEMVKSKVDEFFDAPELMEVDDAFVANVTNIIVAEAQRMAPKMPLKQDDKILVKYRQWPLVIPTKTLYEQIRIRIAVKLRNMQVGAPGTTPGC